MRKRALSVLAAAALLFGGTGTAALAEHGGGQPGPNGNNDYGLCTAYFNGSEQGQEKKRQAPPFQALEDHAGDADGDGESGTPSDVWEYCTSGPGVGGNPDNPNEEGDTPGGGNGNGNG